MLDPSPQRHWNEFEWEEAFRNDDMRIAAYMNDLPLFIDLPQEDELLLARLQSRHKLSVPDQFFWNEEAEEDDPEHEPESPPLSPKAAAAGEILDVIGRISTEWDRLYAIDISESNRETALAVSCTYGTLIARIADIMDERSMDCTGLKIALSKRLLHTLSNLIPTLAAIAAAEPRIANTLNLQIAVIREQCEKVGMLIYRFRTDAQSTAGGTP